MSIIQNCDTIKQTMDVNSFLKQYVVDKNDCTHTQLIPPFGSYHIPNNPETYTTLHKLLDDSYCNNMVNGLCEMHVLDDNNLEPIVIDLNFVFKKPCDDIQPLIIKSLSVFNKTLKSLFRLDNTNLKAFICMKNTNIEQKNKIGIHIHYPYLYVTKENREIANHMLIENYKPDMFGANIQGSISRDIVYGTGLVMYGCTKDINDAPYLLHIIVNAELIAEEFDNSVSLIGLLSLRRWCWDSSIKEVVLQNKHIENISELYDHCNIKPVFAVDIENDHTHYLSTHEKAIIETTKRLLSFINIDRLKDHRQNFDLGNTLHNIHPSLLIEYIKFCQQSTEGFQQSRCVRNWSKYSREGFNQLKMSDLVNWAKEDNLEEYQKFIKEQNIAIIESNLEKKLSTYLVAKIMYNLYQDQYVCTDSKRQEFWHYAPKQHRWVNEKNTTSLHKKVSEDLRFIIKDYLRQLNRRYNEISLLAEGTEREIYKRKYQILDALLDKVDSQLTDFDFISKCIRHGSQYFYSSEFNDKLDKSNIIGCEDGVFDLDMGVFRNGKPSDYVSKRTKRNLKKFFNNTGKWIRTNCYNPDIKYIYDHHKQLHIDEGMCEYIMYLKGSIFLGHKKEQKVYIHRGIGSNGKSADIEKFTKAALGDYCCIVNPTVFTQKNPISNTPRPEILEMQNAFLTVVQEPENDDTLKMSTLKRMTGGDNFKERTLHSGDMIEFRLRCSIFFVCNEAPKLESFDYGSIRRLEYINWKTQFKKNPNPDNKYDRKANNQMEEDIPKYADAYLAVMIKFWLDYHFNKTKKIHVPEEIKMFTNDNISEKDIYNDFMNVHTIPTDGESIKIARLYDIFKIWYEDNYPREKTPNNTEFKSRIKLKFKTIVHKNCIYVQNIVLKEIPKNKEDEE